MQIHRLFEIVYLLIERKTMTAGELAKHFEVSVRTVLRDVEVLSCAGIPVYSSRGRGGGISILDGYVLSKAFFSPSEQAGILAALQQLSATQYPETESILRKLKGIFVRQTADWLEVDFTHWGSTAADKGKLELIQSALMHKQALRFTYSNTRGETAERLAYPLKLCFKAMAWYLSAYCTQKQDYRMFKLGRMRDVTLAQEYFGHLRFSPPPARVADSTLPPAAMTLSFSPRQAHRVFDEFDAEQIAKQEDGRYLVHTAMPRDEWLLYYLLTFGPDLEVLEPHEIRADLAAAAESVLRIYR